MLQSLSGTGSCRCVLRAHVRPLLPEQGFLPTCLYTRQWKFDSRRCLHSSHSTPPRNGLQAVGRVPGPLAAGLHHLHPHPHLVRAACPGCGCGCGSCCGHVLPLPWLPPLPPLQPIVGTNIHTRVILSLAGPTTSTFGGTRTWRSSSTHTTSRRRGGWTLNACEAERFAAPGMRVSQRPAWRTLHNGCCGRVQLSCALLRRLPTHLQVRLPQQGARRQRGAAARLRAQPHW